MIYYRKYQATTNNLNLREDYNNLRTQLEK